MDFNRVKESSVKFGRWLVKTAKNDPIFTTVTVLVYLCFCFEITAVSGNWLSYTINNKGKEGHFKIGLFNSAVNMGNGDQWAVYSHSACVADAKNDPENQLAICNARLTNGILLIFADLIMGVVAFLLSVMISKRLLDFRFRQAKVMVLVGLAVSSIINFICMVVGVVTIHRIVYENYNTTIYGVGFNFSVICWVIEMLLVPAIYFLVDEEGDIYEVPIISSYKD
ncbi:hypothetical protein BC833DRAFT_580420 [Globomyces pollinis-pini]|nr:hypothetical protein BC833DRAFT_580420 [Globomyces pollinis-pini]KAJ2994571.1 hypothetical protein HDV02_001500 [Globomyces sp. JEL0801]